MTILLLASVGFVASHFLLSHPLRAPLVRAMGEKAFAGLYSVVALAMFSWMVIAYRSAPAAVAHWAAGDGLWAIATALMLIASVLLAGSLVGNPAFPNPNARNAPPGSARGVYAITRHPMLWAFAIWGIAHILVYPVGKTFVVAISVIMMCLLAG